MSGNMSDNEVLKFLKVAPRSMDALKRYFNRSRRDVENALRRLRSAKLVYFDRSQWRWCHGAKPQSFPLVSASQPAASRIGANTRYVVLLDGSGSMIGNPATAAKAAVDSDMRAAMSEGMRPMLYTFSERGFVPGGWDERIKLKFDGYVPGNGPQDWAFTPDGNTPLNDSIIAVLNDLMAFPEPCVLIVATDGQENASRNHASVAAQRIRAAIATDRITVAMLVPRGWRDTMALIYGIDPSNIREWNSADVREVEATLNRGSTVSRQAYASHVASTGQLSMNKGYYAPDLSALKATQVAQQLTDLSSRYRVVELPKEWRIDEFVEDKTGYPYVPGEAFYQLMKKEKRAIESNKEILLQEKTTGRMFGGAEARELIGLPPKASFKTVKLEPGNHGDWDVFIQSHSNNRILPRGTKIAFRK